MKGNTEWDLQFEGWNVLWGFTGVGWKRMASFIRGELVGLDIGSSAVKMVGLRRDDSGYTVTAASMAEIALITSSCETEDGIEEDHQRIIAVNAIRECLASTGRKRRLAVCGLSGPEVAVRAFEFPPLSASEIEGAVLFEASQVCPFDPAESTVDHYLMPNGDNKTRGILVAATNSLIESKEKLAKESSLKCVLMDVEGLALLNCFNSLYEDSDKSTTAILNVGSTGTTVAIMGGSGRPFIRDMAFAGDDIIKQLAADKYMSTEDVKRILSCDSAGPQTDLHDSFEKACLKLTANVSETLRYYVTQEQSTPIERILVCGGFVLTRGFIEILNNRLEAEVILWNPFEKIPCDPAQQLGDICDKKGPALAVAAGLAMRKI
jgi:type IV pilus assembly protein PilM